MFRLTMSFTKLRWHRDFIKAPPKCSFDKITVAHCDST